MYFDSCDDPGELRKAIDELLQGTTYIRGTISGPGTQAITMIGPGEDQIMKQAFLEARNVAKRSHKICPALPAVPDAQCRPLEGLGRMLTWCAEAAAKWVQPDQKANGPGPSGGTRMGEQKTPELQLPPAAICLSGMDGAMTDPRIVDRLLDPSAAMTPSEIDQAVKEVLTPRAPRPPIWSLLRLKAVADGQSTGIHSPGPDLASDLEKVYRAAYNRVVDLCKADPPLPEPPAPADNPRVGLQQIRQWCAKTPWQEPEQEPPTEAPENGGFGFGAGAKRIRQTKPPEAVQGDDLNSHAEPDIPLYIEIELAGRTLAVGEKRITPSDKVWEFLKELAAAKRHNLPDLKTDEWKNAVDILRRKIGKENLQFVVESTERGYKLAPDVRLTGGGQMGIRKTK